VSSLTVSAPSAQAPESAVTRLRAARRYYERHVIAWYALGRITQARAARAAIAPSQISRRQEGQ